MKSFLFALAIFLGLCGITLHLLPSGVTPPGFMGPPR